MLASILALAVVQNPVVFHPTFIHEPGDECVLDAEGSTKVIVGTDFFAFGEMHKAVAANDDQGLDDLISKDRAFAVKRGTKVKVIKVYDFRRIGEGHGIEVRILEGNREGQKAFAMASAVVMPVTLPIAKGEPGVLRWPGSDDEVLIASDLGSYNLMCSLLESEDLETLGGLVTRHRLAFVPSGTKIKLVGTGRTFVEVSIVSGRYKKRTAFVHPDCVSK